MSNIVNSPSSIYNKICEKLILPVGDIVTQQSITKLYKFYDKSQWWSRERLVDLQNKKLRNTVKDAYQNTRLYRELFDGAGVKPGDISNVEDLQKIPVVTKEILRQYYPDRSSIQKDIKVSQFSTSGSTGAPFTVFLDNHSVSDSRALMLHRATYSGWKIGDGYLQTGMTLDRGVVKNFKDRLLKVIYVSAFDLSEHVLDEYLRAISHNKCRYIMGYASSLYLIAIRAKEVGFNCRINGIVSWGDNMYPHYRKEIEDQFGCKVTDTYGCGEGIQVAAQCQESDGSYHVFMPHVVVEYAQNGIHVPNGELGEIVLTRLHAGAMPLIRYKVGDMGRADVRSECACGRGLEMMKSIEGRASDIIVTPNGNRLIVHFFTGIFEYAIHIETFQVVQEEKDKIKVRIVPKSEFNEEEWFRLKEEIRTKGDSDLGIELEVVDKIPLEKSNKRRFVISRIDLK